MLHGGRDIGAAASAVVLRRADSSSSCWLQPVSESRGLAPLQSGQVWPRAILVNSGMDAMSGRSDMDALRV